VRFETLQIDVGWGDPLVAPPFALAIEGVPVPVPAVRPEILFAWKIHGLFEFGHGNWHPKDLFDLYLFDRHVTLDAALLAEALRVAFASRGTPLSLADRFLFGTEWGTSRGSRQRWASFGRKRRGTLALPPLADVIAAVRMRILPVFAAIGHTHAS
jgi:hypothetical protein